MSSFVEAIQQFGENPNRVSDDDVVRPELAEAEAVLLDLARVFAAPAMNLSDALRPFALQESVADACEPNLEAKYRALLEQVPAVVFMAYLDRGISEAYVSPEIESVLGYSREEWLEDPVRWYEHIHPEDKQRWSLEAAEMFLSGKPLRSAYRCPHDAAGRRPSVVHSRRRVRRFGSQADRRGAERRTQFHFRNS